MQVERWEYVVSTIGQYEEAVKGNEIAGVDSQKNTRTTSTGKIRFA